MAKNVLSIHLQTDAEINFNSDITALGGKVYLLLFIAYVVKKILTLELVRKSGNSLHFDGALVLKQ